MKTPIPFRRDYTSPDPIRKMISTALNHAVALAQFEEDSRRWGRGTVRLELTPAQYKKLREAGMGRKPPGSAS